MSSLLAASAGRVAVGGEAVLSRSFLTLTLGDDLLALPIEQLREIIEFGGLTEIPMMPGFLRGMINLRGAVVPVVDLAVRFGRERTRIGKRTCIVILELEQPGGMQLLGIIVDAVNAVQEFAPGQLGPRPNFGMSIRADFLAGIIRQDEQFVMVLDVAQVFSLEELNELVEASA